MSDINIGAITEALNKMLGKRFGHLIVIDYAGTNKHQNKQIRLESTKGLNCKNKE